MDVDFFEPATSLGKNIQCLTLTDSFFRKKKIDSTKQSLLKNFLTFKVLRSGAIIRITRGKN